ncbi:MAG: heavy metal translocating P-type ATPase [bacterium]
MNKKQKKALRDIIISGIIYAALLIIEHTHMIEIKPFIMFLFYLIPYYIVGWPVLRKALIGIKNKQMFDESFLMSLATIGAFITGQFGEGVAVMLFYQIGEWFQSYAVGQSRQSIAELMDIVPEHANVERDGTIEVIDPDEVEVNDILVIKPGERIPVDGVVISGESLLNTAALTGESVPRAVHPGETIISGCINGEGMLRIKAEKAYEDSTLAKILELVENAASKKSKTENFITRFARYYTPIVVFSALALAIIPTLFTGHVLTWVYRACTFLVISCPCALVVSVPLAFFGGIGAGSRNGVLVKGSNYLEQMAMVDTIVSDKTGTLTKGVFKVTKLIPQNGVDAQELLKKAAIAESMSTHPIAKSIRDAYQQKPDQAIVKVENVSGKGLIATTEDDVIYAGNYRLLTDHQIACEKIDDPQSTIVYVASHSRYLGAILIADEIKDEAPEAIMKLKELGIKRFVMLTGDRREVSEAVGRALNIDTVESELLPDQKVACVEKLLSEKDENKKLAFIGDGINDAPVLSRADVGIAMGSLGSDAAIEAADIVIMDDHLDRLITTIRIARKTVGISKQNIVFAIGVKILILILGAFGLANMWAAVFADVGVAFLCILNSMRTLGIS